MNAVEVLGMFGMFIVAMIATMLYTDDDFSRCQRRIAGIVALLFGVPVLVKIWILGVMG